MGSFTSYDGTRIGYRTVGDGPVVVCLPGGPGLTTDYFGDLGGLSRHRQLIMPDTRGTGLSETPADPLSYRCDRLVEDVESLRAHLGLDRMDLLGHSAAGNLAALYAAAHPPRVAHLILLTPVLDALGIDHPAEERWRAALQRRSAEPWYQDAIAAIEKEEAGDDSAENRRTYLPFFYGRWDEAARAHADGISEPNSAARDGFRGEGAFNPRASREAVSQLAAPVLVYAGEFDPAPTPEIAASGARLFPTATLAVQPGGGHFPWLDDPAFFCSAIEAFLQA